MQSQLLFVLDGLLSGIARYGLNISALESWVLSLLAAVFIDVDLSPAQ